MLGEDFYVAIHETELAIEDRRRERIEEDAIENAAPLGIYFRGVDNQLLFLAEGATKPTATPIVTLTDPITVRITPTVQYTFFTSVNNSVHVYNGKHLIPMAGLEVNTVTRLSAVYLHRTVHVFAVGINGELYHASRNVTTALPFSEFKSLGGELVPGEQVCVIPQRETQSLLVVANDFRLGAAALTFANDEFGKWEAIGLRIHSALAGISTAAGHFDVFGANNGKLIHLWKDAELMEWRSFESALPNNHCLGNAGGVTVIADKANQEMHIFYQSPTSHLMHVVRDAHQWQDPANLGGLLSHPPEAHLVFVDGKWRIQVVTRWADGHIYTLTQKDDDGKKWHDWQPLECFAAGLPSL